MPKNPSFFLPLACFLVSRSFAVAEEPKLPEPAAKQVDYANDIHPILKTNCLKCHGATKPKSNYRLDGRETAIKGGDLGAAIVPGKSAESALIKFVAGLDPDVRMPPKGDLLPAEQVAILRAWIDQGVKWAEVAVVEEPQRDDVKAIEGAKSWVTSVAFAPDGQTLASGGGQTLIFKPGEVHVWDLKEGKERAALGGHESTVWSVAFDGEGKTLASASHDKVAKLWDISTMKERAALKGHANWITSVAFSPDGSLVATGSEDATAKLWKAASGEEKATLSGHKATVRGVAFARDGKLLATASFDKTVKLWDVEKGAEAETLEGHEDAVWSVAFSSDKETLATASADGTVKLWKLAAPGGKTQLLDTLKGHGNWVSCVAFSPRGDRLASAGFDRTVILWDLKLREETSRLDGLHTVPWSVSFAPDGGRLAVGLGATAEGDETVKVWTLPTGQPF